MSIEIRKNLGHTLGVEDGNLDLTVNDAGQVLRATPSKYLPISSWTPSSIRPVIMSNGIIMVLMSELPEVPDTYTYAHLEYTLTYNPSFVSDGSPNEDVLYQFSSVDQDGWVMEYTDVYTFPGTGYTSWHTTRKLRARHIAPDLDLDLEQDLYLFYRSRGCNVIGDDLELSEDYSDYNGNKVNMLSSSFSNTSETRSSQLEINLLPEISSYYSAWPAGKSVHYEIYIGESGTYSDYSTGGVIPLEYADSEISPTGFKYFDGTKFVNLNDGIPSALHGTAVSFTSQVVDTKKSLFAIYRAKWSGGSTNWISKVISSHNVIDSTTKVFTPNAYTFIEAGTYQAGYHMHMIVGTSPDIAEYFDDGLTDDFSKINYQFDGLVDYASTINVSDLGRFSYYKDGVIGAPDQFGFEHDSDISLTYASAQNYTNDDQLYVFWRAEYGSTLVYGLAGYQDYDIDPCLNCISATSYYYDNPWDGTFVSAGTVWHGDGDSISGKRFFSAVIVPDGLNWNLSITCADVSSSSVIWEGVKIGGLTPDGVYLRSEGCDPTSALLVEQIS